MFFLKKALDDNNRVFENNSFAENAYFIIDDTFHGADTKQFFYQRLLLSKFLEVETSIVIKVKLTLFVNNKFQIFKKFFYLYKRNQNLIENWRAIS